MGFVACLLLGAAGYFSLTSSEGATMDRFPLKRRSPAVPRSSSIAAGVNPSDAFMAEDAGAVYRRLEDGAVAPASAIVKEHGYQWVRLRIMVDPNGKYGLVWIWIICCEWHVKPSSITNSNFCWTFIISLVG